MIRLAIFEDNKAFLETIKLLFEAHPKYLLVGTFNNAQAALKNVIDCQPDIILMDIKMPEVSGIEAVSKIKERFPKILILMQSFFDDDNNVFSAICAGASGYILKGGNLQNLFQALDETLLGGSPMSPPIARKVLTMFQNKYSLQTPFYDLSTREKEILKYLADGFSYQKIADVCFISYHTVNAHLRKIYEKLHVNSAQEAIVKAFKEKII